MPCFSCSRRNTSCQDDSVDFCSFYHCVLQLAALSFFVTLLSWSFWTCCSNLFRWIFPLPLQSLPSYVTRTSSQCPSSYRTTLTQMLAQLTLKTMLASQKSTTTLFPSNLVSWSVTASNLRVRTESTWITRTRYIWKWHSLIQRIAPLFEVSASSFPSCVPTKEKLSWPERFRTVPKPP